MKASPRKNIGLLALALMLTPITESANAFDVKKPIEWLTHTDPEYQFSVQYPSSWMLEKGVSDWGQPYVTMGTEPFGFGIGPKGGGFENGFLLCLPLTEPIESSKILVDGRKAVKKVFDLSGALVKIDNSTFPAGTIFVHIHLLNEYPSTWTEENAIAYLTPQAEAGIMNKMVNSINFLDQ